MNNAGDYRKEILQFARENCTVPQLKFILDDMDGVVIEQVTTGGLVNYIYRVQSANGEVSLIVKHAEDSPRVLPGSCNFPSKRQMVEFEALKLIHRLHPGSVPKPYCFDNKHRIIAMEDLGHMHMLYDNINKGKMDRDLARQLGQMLANLHWSTHRENVTPGYWQILKEKFGHKDTKDFVRSYRLEKFYREESPEVEIPTQCLETFRKCLGQLEVYGALGKLIDLYNTEQCVVHVDTHNKSIFISDSRIALIDLEWTTIGNPAIDVAFTLTYYIFSMLELKDRPGTNQQANRENTKYALEYLMDGYLTSYENYLRDPKARGSFISEVSAFLGAYLFGHTNFSNIEEFAVLSPARRIESMELGTRLMTYFFTRPLTDIPALTQIVFPDIQ